jgi:hypothetical protein
VDKSQFLAVTQIDALLLSIDLYVSTCVYQSADAPIPMKDWTIKSVSIFTHDMYTQLDKDNGMYLFFPDEDIGYDNIDTYNPQNIFKYNLEKKCILMSKYDPVNNASFIQLIKDAYTEGLSSPQQGNLDKAMDRASDRYFVLIEFEENDNIFWWSHVYHQNGELYLKCNNYKYHEYKKNQNYYFKLPEELNNEIIEILRSDGCEIPDSTTAEETTEDPYQPTTEDPDGSIAWPYDD